MMKRQKDVEKLNEKLDAIIKDIIGLKARVSALEHTPEESVSTGADAETEAKDMLYEWINGKEVIRNNG